MFPILQIGPIAIQTSGLILILSLWIGLSLSERLSPQFNLLPNDVYNIVFVFLIAGIVAARLAYIFQYFSSFQNAPFNIFSLNPRLLDAQSGVVIGLVVSAAFANKKNLPLWSTLDALTPFFAVFHLAFWLSQFASGSLYGRATGLPWGIELWGAHRHPVQIYYLLSGLIILWLIWPRKIITPLNPGSLFLAFLSLTSTTVLFLETFRAETPLLFSGIRLTQVFAWLLLAISVVLRQKCCKPA
jgi:phosphatidylglycerol:prolipoprotein diacylglycerol transferase